ncbi:MAG TPA: hypothetical protein VK825_12580 [Xanthobacteraceae bacterium]|jgi:hypothetical protein|nr:hypothetical protein [Xanthobacteraceae bacterium]
MAISGISSSPQASQAVSSSALHRHSRNQAPSISDVDGQSSSVASAAPSTGRVGKAVDITV